MATNKASTIVPATPPTMPLSPANKAICNALYDHLQDEIENNTDPTYLGLLNDARQEVADILDLDDKYRLAKNTGEFSTILTEIKATNQDLDSLKDQIAAIAAHIATAAAVAAAIDKVITLIPSF